MGKSMLFPIGNRHLNRVPESDMQAEMQRGYISRGASCNPTGATVQFVITTVRSVAHAGQVGIIDFAFSVACATGVCNLSN